MLELEYTPNNLQVGMIFNDDTYEQWCDDCREPLPKKEFYYITLGGSLICKKCITKHKVEVIL